MLKSNCVVSVFSIVLGRYFSPPPPFFLLSLFFFLHRMASVTKREQSLQAMDLCIFLTEFVSITSHYYAAQVEKEETITKLKSRAAETVQETN